MENKRLTERQILDLRYTLGMLDDVIIGAPDDLADDIRVLENIANWCTEIANELKQIDKESECPSQ